MFKKLSLLLLTISSISLSACGNNQKPTPTYNHDNFYGICALTGENASGVDKALTNAWTARNIKAMNFKSQRVWLAPLNLFSVDDYDNLSVIKSYYNVMKDHFQQSQKAGIKSFCMMVTAFIYPKGYTHSTGYVVPDPEEDKDFYIRWLNLNAKAAAEIIKLFPEITIYEPANEPDFKNSSCIHRNGYTAGGDYAQNADYCYNDEVKANIICDMCWYIRRAIREVNPNVRVALPGLTNLDTVYDFLDTIYQQIESHTLPVGTKTSDTNPDNYFDLLNWHPYTKTTTEPDDTWVQMALDMHAVAEKHDDGEKPTIFTEFGFTSFNASGEKEKELATNFGNWYCKAADLIKANMPWVETIFYFRMTNLYYQQVAADGGEEHFGMFYHPDDPEHFGAPRESAKILAKYINGADYNLEEHLDDYSKL